MGLTVTERKTILDFCHSDRAKKLAKKVIDGTDGRCILFTPKYMDVIWDRRKCLLNDSESFDKPVGLVLNGVLEVTEEFKIGSETTRRRATALMKPGMFFGLFEAFGQLNGDWKITSGVTRIFISNNLGDKKTLTRLGLRHSLMDMHSTLKFAKDAAMDYSILLNSIGDPNWCAPLLLFDAKNANDELQKALHTETIAQLSSLIKQNPHGAFREKAKGGKCVFLPDAPQLSTLAVLEGIMNNHIPVHRLAKPKEDELLFPYKALIEKLGFGKKDKNGKLIHAHEPHIFVPDYVSSTNVAVYIHELSRKLNLSHLEDIIYALDGNNTTSVKAAPNGMQVHDLYIMKNATHKTGFRCIASMGDIRCGIHRTALQTQNKKVELPAVLANQLGDYAWDEHFADTVTFYRLDI